MLEQAWQRQKEMAPKDYDLGKLMLLYSEVVLGLGAYIVFKNEQEFMAFLCTLLCAFNLLVITHGIQVKKELEKSIEKTVLKMAMDPKNTDLYHELAKYYALDNQYEKVISVYESLLEIDPKDLQIDDVIVVKMGEVLPVDGVVIDGNYKTRKCRTYIESVDRKNNSSLIGVVLQEGRKHQFGSIGGIP